MTTENLPATMESTDGFPPVKLSGSMEATKKAVSLFDVADTAYVRSIPVSVARDVLAFCQPGAEKVTKEQAAAMVDKLLLLFTHQSFKSEAAAAAMTAAITALVTEVSVNAARRAFNPLTGLPRKVEFLSVATVADALEREEKRMVRIMGNCRWLIAQKAEADKAAKLEAEIEASKGSAEERAARVKALLGSLKAKAADAA